jgi:hypothetical protein
MSRPAVPVSAASKILEAPTSEVAEVATSSPELVRRVVFECNATGAGLANGRVVNIQNASHVFAPHISSDLAPEEKAALQAKSFDQAIVTSMTLKSVSSSCPEVVTVGINLFANNANVSNAKGWLYTQEVNDMSSNHAHANEGFTNVVTILPHEKHRTDQVVYHPEGLMNSRWIQEYGGYDLEKLHDGITRFQGKDYCYVPEDHVVVSIIRNNWEQLGINLQDESMKEGEFLKINKTVVDNCINQLYSSVISQIPYTSLSNLGARFQANTEGSQPYKVVAEFLIKYRFP